MNHAVVALGGNVGDVPQTFEAALRTLADHDRIRELQSTGLFSSAPMGEHSGDQFFNSACRFMTTLAPLELLDLLQTIENVSGRQRTVHWGPRTLDLDLIFYGDEIIQTDRLTVPHPHCWYRRFVLDPIVSIAPDLVHPFQLLTLTELQQRLTRRPFQLLISGPGIDCPVDEVAREFDDVVVTRIEKPDSGEIKGASFAIWLNDDSQADRQDPGRLWLPCEVRGAEVTIRDALTAATDGVSRLSSS